MQLIKWNGYQDGVKIVLQDRLLPVRIGALVVNEPGEYRFQRFLMNPEMLFSSSTTRTLSLIIIAAISGIAGFILSIIFHRFKVSKKHMIVYAIMFAIFFYIDIMYIGFSSQNVF